MIATDIVRKALEVLVKAVDDSFIDDIDIMKATEYARAVLDITEESK